MYPFNLLDKEISPIFGKEISGLPLYIDLSVDNKEVHNEKFINNQKDFCEYMFRKINDANKKWAVSSYLEDRSIMLKKYPQMLKEKRYYHLGLDITLPLGTALYTPLDSEVVISEYEDGKGNYGGMVVLKHNINNVVFYTLFGHLNKNKLPVIGKKLKRGEQFALIGDYFENGNWFYHTHLQVLTENGFINNWINRGYCSEEDIKSIYKYCPNPIFMLKIWL